MSLEQAIEYALGEPAHEENAHPLTRRELEILRLVAQGMSNQTSFLRPITSGTIHAEARRRHRGRTTWVWEVDITDDEGRLCALVRMTVAVR